MRRPLDFAARLEGWLDPVEPHERAALDALTEFLREVLPPGRSDALDVSSTTPEAELAALLRGPIGAAMVPEEDGGTLDWSVLMRLCARLSAADLGFTLCLGGVVLGALPLLVAGTPEQRRAFFDDLRAGGLAGLGLSEWEHGSDLLAGATTATPLDADDPKLATRFSLRGRKRPINNASRARRLVVLARTARTGDSTGSSDGTPANASSFAHTLFLLRREHASASGTLRSEGRVPWIGYPGMDLDAIVMEDLEVGRDAVLGKVGEGFVLARRTLEISRGGVATMAAGAGSVAWSHALDHVRARQLYGAPAVALGAVQRHLADLFVHRALATALTRTTARACAIAALSARPWTCAAKLLAPALLERDVHLAGTLLGARSLMREHPFHRLRRDAPVLAIFDGSSQLQCDELWRHALVWPDTAEVRALRGPTPFTPATAWAEDSSVSALAPTTLLVDAPWRSVALALREAAGRARRGSQNERFAVSECAAWLYGLGALVHRAGADHPATHHARALVARELVGRLPEVVPASAVVSPLIAEAAMIGRTASTLFERLEDEGWISS